MLKRKQGLTRRKGLRSDPAKALAWKRRTATKLGRGKKVKEWDKERSRLKRTFAAAGVTRCEFGYRYCRGDDMLSFAHAQKRRNIAKGDLGRVALACIPCHNILERLPEAEMQRRVEEKIAARGLL